LHLLVLHLVKPPSAFFQQQLSERSAQFRSIERRLLTRFKDKTPTPLTNLDTLLEATYRQVSIS
jgi:Bardet-Biedl syndrome 9 protein